MKFSTLIPVLFICLFFAACSSEEGEGENQDEDLSENGDDAAQVDEEETKPDDGEEYLNEVATMLMRFLGQ